MQIKALMEKDLELWFKEAESSLRVFSFGLCEAIFYKGFKISKHPNNSFLLKDVRYRDEYSEVKPKDLKIIKEYGFIEGVDRVSNSFNNSKVLKLTRRVEKLYAKIKKAKRDLPKDERLNKKRIRLANKNIDILVDLIFLHKSRIQQFKNKYNE